MFRCGGADFIACPFILRICRSSAEECEEVDWLLTQAEAIKQGAIPIPVRTAQVIEQFATPADHPQQSTAGMMILHMIFEMSSQIVDARGQQCNLYFRRAGIGYCPLVVLQNLSLLARPDPQHPTSQKKARIFPFETPR